MSYITVRGYGESLNGDSFEVRIIHNTSGSDTTKEFALDPTGFTLTYESEDDAMLLPGIVHSRCTINTIWSSDEFSTLDTLISSIGASQDGDYLMQVIYDSASIWVGNILVEEISVSEDSAQRGVRFVASDAIGLLRNVDYNNAGTAYTGYQTVQDIFKNIQEKWVLWDYMNAQYTTEDRLVFVDDVYSTDDYIMAALVHPAGTDNSTLTRSRIHTNPWSKTNASGDEEYISCYDLLQSLCLTYQFRLYSYGTAWYMLPCALAATDADAYTLQYNGSAGVDTPLERWNYQLTGADTRQKGNEWVRTFTPQTKEISLTRDANQGATILSGVNFTDGDTLTAANVTYEGADTADEEDRYVVTGRVYVSNSSITIDDNDDLGRLLLKFEIKWDPTGTPEYYKNTLAVMQTGALDAVQNFVFNNVNYARFAIYAPEYSATAATFYVMAEPFEQGHYTPSVAGSRYIDFNFAVPPPQTAKTGLTVTASVQAYNTQGQESSTLQAALTIDWAYMYVQKWSGDQLELINNFDFVAQSTLGQNKRNIGTTYVGALGASMGRIEVQTSAGVYGTTDNWVNQASNDARPINELCVEELLAGHTRARTLEKGSIVFRGTATPPKPFSRFYDSDTATTYTPINWELQATPCEVGVTLRFVGRNAISITTDYANTGRVPDGVAGDTLQGAVKPADIMYGYNSDARDNFDGDWSAVIGAGETKEMYLTTSNLGQGRYIDDQGNSPAVGNVIVRTVYVNTKGLSTRTDSGWTSPAALQPPNDGTLADVFELMNTYVSRTTDHGSYSFMVTYKETSAFTGILDTYTTASAAYSTRRLSSTYTSSLLRVRRADGSEQDIGYDADGHLDESAISTFAGGTACTVATWYDQSGNGNDLTNTNVSAQPQIYDGTVFYSIGTGTPARKALLFSSDYLQATADLHAGAFYATSAVVTGTTIGNLSILNQDDSLASGTARIGQYLRTGSANNTARCVVFNTSGSNFADNTANNTVATGNSYVISSHGKSSQVEAFVDNVSNGHTSITGPLRHGSGLYRVGANAHTTTPGALWDGRIAEVLFFDEDMSSGHQTGVVNDISTYFDI